MYLSVQIGILLYFLTSSEQWLSVELTSLGVTGNSSGVSIRDGKSNLGSEPDRVSAVAFLKLIGSNLDGSGMPAECVGKTSPAPPPPVKYHHHIDHYRTKIMQY